MYGLCIMLILVFQPVSPTAAHHSLRAEYDVTKPLNLTGRVTKIEWENPHVRFSIDVTDAQSKKTVNWVLEMNAPSVIEKYGWTRDTMKIGDVVIVDLLLARSGCACGSARKVTIPSTGKKLGPLYG